MSLDIQPVQPTALGTHCLTVTILWTEMSQGLLVDLFYPLLIRMMSIEVELASSGFQLLLETTLLTEAHGCLTIKAVMNLDTILAGKRDRV